jgi:histone H3/H4
MKISSRLVRKAVRKRSDVAISEKAASAIAKILEEKANSIAIYAVKRAKKNGRSTVIKEDVDNYRLKFGG